MADQVSVDEAASRIARALEEGPPVLLANERDLAEQSDEAYGALVAANDPPVIFRQAGTLSRVVQTDDAVRLEAIGRPALRDLLARSARWVRMRDRDGTTTAAHPPLAVVDGVLARDGWAELPPIERVVTAPVYGPDRRIADRPGYNRAARTWYEPGCLRVPAVDREPTPADLERARALICDELLGDFPFVAEADRAGVVALLLAPFVRGMIDGPTPLHLIEAPGPGVGKGLLSDVVLLPALGSSVARLAEGRDEDEWRKRITALLLSGTAAAVIDNLRLPLDSGALAAALTAREWEDRLLGRSRMVSARVRTVWAATGNNPVLTTEMARRSVRIRLDVGIDRPWLRTGFRHSGLHAWAAAHRGELVWAALTLVQAWLVVGAPAGERTLGMFDDWAGVVGGILAVAGVEGFLDNLSEFYAASDGELASLVALIESWWEVHGDYPVTIGQLWTLAEMSDLDLGSGSERSQRTRLGRLISAQRDRVIGDYRVRSAGVSHQAAKWHLERREVL